MMQKTQSTARERLPQGFLAQQTGNIISSGRDSPGQMNPKRTVILRTSNS